jgi:16S rRNA (cytidine1402-2'-O)-methyltransferase
VSVGTLYVVATPIGNLEDLSARAAGVLRGVSVVAAEDTRRARILLSHVDATPRLLSFHAHSPDPRLAELISVLDAGDDVAVISDAGTPTVSDPGAMLVRRALDAGAEVVAVPGPSAVAAALSVSGIPADRYLFLGFPPRKGKDRRRLLDTVATALWTSVLFEAPNRVVALLRDLAGRCDSRREAAVTRELTKLHEEVRTGTLAELAGYYEEHPPRGEVTVVVAAGEPVPEELDETAVEARARTLLDQGMSRRDAADCLAREFPMPRREAYRIVTGL